MLLVIYNYDSFTINQAQYFEIGVAMQIFYNDKIVAHRSRAAQSRSPAHLPQALNAQRGQLKFGHF